MFYANVEMNELLYSEADIKAAQFAIVQSYAGLVRITSANLHAEADSKSGDGVLAKILNFFKNLGKKIIEFIKKVINLTLSLILKPFGAKIAIGSNGKSTESAGGGGGSSSGSSSSDTPKSDMAPKSGNMTEIANILKKLSAYLQSESISDISYKAIVNANNPFVKANKALYAEINKDKSKSDIQSSIKTCKSIIQDIETVFTNFKSYNNKLHKSDKIINPNSAEQLLANALSNTTTSTTQERQAIVDMAKPNNNGDVLVPIAHPNFSASFNVVDPKKLNDFRKHTAALAALLDVISVSSSMCDSINDEADDWLKSANLDYDKTCKSIGRGAVAITINSAKSTKTKTINQFLGTTDKSDDFNIFGVPVMTCIVGTSFFFLRSLEQGHYEKFMNKYLIDKLESSCPDLKDYTGPAYRGVLTSNKAYDFAAIDKVFRPVSLSANGNLKDFMKTIAESNSVDILQSASKFESTLQDFKNMDYDLSDKDNKDKSASEEIGDRSDKIATELSGKGNPAAALREFITGAAKIIRHMATVTGDTCKSMREVYFEIDGANKAGGVVLLANTIMYKRDYVHYACKEINGLLNDEAYRKKEGIKDKELETFRNDIKGILKDMTTLSSKNKF